MLLAPQAAVLRRQRQRLLLLALNQSVLQAGTMADGGMPPTHLKVLRKRWLDSLATSVDAVWMLFFGAICRSMDPHNL
ncbi:hypothetical protein EZI45_10215 [Delftia tsuruhatensis]|uniref:hypothetical protein n=1 Tax=Delftia tsuruhatensis TaxID=180282 RepID=UPI001054D57B|nr:hypothetical protein [Delftia tsuruhatensis]TDF29909.1 hypothetical protein EZI45_10215 [Delftia tsuruhatensis]